MLNLIYSWLISNNYIIQIHFFDFVVVRLRHSELHVEEVWKFGSLEVWEFGSLGVWEFGGWGVWRLGQ